MYSNSVFKESNLLEVSTTLVGFNKIYPNKIAIAINNAIITFCT